MDMNLHELIDRQIRAKFELDEDFEKRHREHLERQFTPAKYLFNNLSIDCPAGVYHPNIGSSSLFLLSQLNRIDFFPDSSFLEVGTGCGVVILNMAQKIGSGIFHGSDNINVAVEATRQNAKKNSLQVEVFQSDLFDSLPNQLYDYIIFNPPLLDRPTTDELDLAMMSDPSGTTIRRFLSEAPTRLKQGGSVFVLQANFGDMSYIEQLRLPYTWIGCESFCNGTIRALLEVKNI